MNSANEVVNHLDTSVTPGSIISDLDESTVIDWQLPVISFVEDYCTIHKLLVDLI